MEGLIEAEAWLVGDAENSINQVNSCKARPFLLFEFDHLGT